VYGQVTTVPAQSADYTKDTHFYQVNCPFGSFVTGFTVTTDSSIALDANLVQNDVLVTSLWPLRCSNGDSIGKDVKLQTLPKSSSAYNRRGGGYTGLTLFTGELVDALSLQPGGAKYGGSGGGDVRRVSCPPGQVITGIWGQASATHVISVGLDCRKVCGSNEHSSLDR
jgi:hypothetical protein